MRLVIFDCDGTLIDSQNAIVAAMADAFASQGLAPPPRERVLGVVGLSLPEAFRELAPAEPATRRVALAEAYRTAFTSGRVKGERHEPLYPGIREAIAALAREPETLLGVATGKSRRGVDRLFNREQWAGHFVTVQTADEHPSKPHPSMILQSMAETGAAPHQTIMIGDTTYDMAMAEAAGVRALGVGWGYHEPDALLAAGAHAVVTEHGRLLDAIERVLAAEGRRLR